MLREDTPIKLEYIIPITTIAQELENNNIPYTCLQLWDGLQIRFPWHDGDIACHGGTYGHEIGHVESYCFPWDNPDCTELTVDEAIELLTDFYKKYEGGE